MYDYDFYKIGRELLNYIKDFKKFISPQLFEVINKFYDKYKEGNEEAHDSLNQGYINSLLVKMKMNIPIEILFDTKEIISNIIFIILIILIFPIHISKENLIDIN